MSDHVLVNAQEYEVQLPLKHIDAPEKELNVKVELAGNAIWLSPDDYGDKGSADGFGSVAYLEVLDGCLRLIVFADINQEDPTHIIELEGARESARTDP